MSVKSTHAPKNNTGLTGYLKNVSFCSHLNSLDAPKCYILRTVRGFKGMSTALSESHSRPCNVSHHQSHKP